MKVLFSPIVLSKVFCVALDNKDVEVAGFLVGRVKGNSILVTDSFWAGKRGSITYVQLDFDFMAKVADELEREGRGEVIVGWWHSHPGIGADFMSEIDVKTQHVYQKFFPQAMALIVDPIEYEKMGINERSCRLYRIVDNKCEVVPFEITLELNELVSEGIRFIKKALGGGLEKTSLTRETINYMIEEPKKTSELLLIVLLVWTMTLALLFWALA